MWTNERGYCQWALRVNGPSGPLRDFQRWLRRRMAGLASARSPGNEDGASDESESDAFARSLRCLRRAVEARLTVQDLLLESSDGDAEDEDDDGEDDDDDDAEDEDTVGGHLGDGSRNAHQAPTRTAMAGLLNRLPRVTYTRQLFSGEPYPDACPICMEDFDPASSSTQATRHEILLTPCLHVFHAPCLATWLIGKGAPGGVSGLGRGCPTCRWDITDTGEAGELATAPRALPLIPPSLAGTTVVLSDDEDNDGDS